MQLTSDGDRPPSSPDDSDLGETPRTLRTAMGIDAGLKLFYGTLTVADSTGALLDGASFVEHATTAPRYRLFSLDGFPVLVADAENGGAIDVQIWEVTDALWSTIVATEPPEMAQQSVELDDGQWVETMLGTLPFVELRSGVEVTQHGSWRAYRIFESPDR